MKIYLDRIVLFQHFNTLCPERVNVHIRTRSVDILAKCLIVSCEERERSRKDREQQRETERVHSYCYR